MNNTAYLSPREQFVLRHGGADACLNIGGLLYFADGASMDRHPHGPMSEPPSDPFELAKRQLKYHEELLKRATRQFVELKTQLMGMATANRRMGYGAPAESGIGQLKELQKIVRNHQAQVATARERMEKAKPVIDKQRDINAAYDQQSLDRFETAIHDIKI